MESNNGQSLTKSTKGSHAKHVMTFKVYLKVNYEEKNEAKLLGCKWDSVAKQWYISVTKPAVLSAFKRFELEHVGFDDMGGAIGFDEFKSMYGVVKQISVSCRKQRNATQ
jgi:hypothetical protein